MEMLKSKLFEAATQNSITSLHQLLEDDPLILDRSFVNRFNETPLHVAAMLGHVDFVKEIIAIKPQLVNELNSQRSSSLHLASAKGHADVVKALVSVDNRACLDFDRDEMSPLHLAAANGHVEVMNVLLEAQPEAIYGGGGETILHLCVKRYQLEALKLLVMKSECDKEFVNSKDSDGNTALHLAVADKQVETVKYLVSVSGVEVNAINNEGLTALEVLIRSRRDLRDSEIEKSLKNAGGFEIPATTHNPPARNTSQPKGGWVDKTKESLQVVASLIATMAFQVGVNPPGGVWQDDDIKSVSEPHVAGTSVFEYKHPEDYKLFYSVNTIAFVAPLSIILLLNSGLHLKYRVFMWILMVVTWISIIAIALSYAITIYVVTPADKLGSVMHVIAYTMIVGIVLIALILITLTIRVILKLLRIIWKLVTKIIRIIVKLVKKIIKLALVMRWRRSSTASTRLAGP